MAMHNHKVIAAILLAVGILEYQQDVITWKLSTTEFDGLKYKIYKA